MQSIAACGDCHTPQGPDGPLRTMELAGGLKIEAMPLPAYAGSIAPGKGAGIGNSTEVRIITARREGRRPADSIRMRPA